MPPNSSRAYTKAYNRADVKFSEVAVYNINLHQGYNFRTITNGSNLCKNFLCSVRKKAVSFGNLSQTLLSAVLTWT